MKTLALEAYYGGSHKAFVDGWRGHSEHDFTLLTLPPNKWKWRMRHGAITFAQQVNDLVRQGGTWDVLFCSDMLNLAEFCGLVDESVRQLPKIVYFHENQLTYPVQVESERDYQYCMTNITTALAADAVWFNSAFHRDEFLGAIERFLKRMPDYQPLEAVEPIRDKSSIHPPGIVPIASRCESAETIAFPARREKPCHPVRILWAARWEHDKNPEGFFAAMKLLKDRGLDFRLNVIGEQFRDCPEVFGWARDYFTDHIDRWGYQPNRAEYEQALRESDIVVSTANHEFFGIGVLEAISAGCYPLLPERLSYPAIISSLAEGHQRAFLYEGTVQGLADRLGLLIKDRPWKEFRLIDKISPYLWPNRALHMDRAISQK